MSLSPNAASSTRRDSPYRRDHWWGEDVEDGDSGGYTHRTDGPCPGIAEMEAAWKAHAVLHDSATKLCGRADSERNEEVELTDPVIRPPSRSASQQRHRKRYNPETGWISGGESTWVKLKDRPRREFMEIVDIVLVMAQHGEYGVGEEEAKLLRDRARQLKGEQDYTDEDIMTEIIRAIVTPGSPE